MSAWAKACSGSRGSTAHFLTGPNPWTPASNWTSPSPLIPNPPASSPTATPPQPQPHPPPPSPSSGRESSVSRVLRQQYQVRGQRNPNPDAAKPFSTFQSLSAHIRRHVTQARSLRPEDVTVCTVFADCRNRIDPPVPESYIGNIIQAIFMGTAAGLILVHPPSFGAALIQKAIVSHDAATVNERNKQWEEAPKIFQFKDAGANCVAVESSPRFKVYEVDFGWGKPEGVRSGSNNCFDGMVYLYQGKSGGRSIDVEISLEAGAMGRLKMDKAFSTDD